MNYEISTRGEKLMVKEVVTGKREPIGHHGKPLHGGTPLQDATKIMPCM